MAGRSGLIFDSIILYYAIVLRAMATEKIPPARRREMHSKLCSASYQGSIQVKPVRFRQWLEGC